MMKQTVFFLLFILMFHKVSIAQDKLVLDGYVKGYEGKVKLILNFIKSNHEADMENEQILYMIDGRFKIEGQVSSPSLLSIRIRPEITNDDDAHLFESAFVWVDNKKMILNGEKGDFEYCDVTGYSRQDENEKNNIYVKDKLNDHQRRIDSLSNLQSAAAKEELQKLKSDSKVYLRNKYRLDYCYLNPDSFVSVYNYSWYTRWIPEMVPKSYAIEFYNALEDGLKNNIHGKDIKNYIDNISVNKKLEMGERPYAFSLPDATGNEISLDSLSGKVILLDFWASYCGPCRKEHKNYVELYDKYNKLGFEIFSVSQDRNKNQWIKAMLKDNIDWSSVWDESMNISKYTFLVTALPQNYLINKEGTIIGINVTGNDLQDILTKLFYEE